ncbi:hypothetical protein [Acetobacterium wieringae]
MIDKLCKALRCQPGVIIEYLEEEPEPQKIGRKLGTSL